jgi:hypothetical protein
LIVPVNVSTPVPRVAPVLQSISCVKSTVAVPVMSPAYSLTKPVVAQRSRYTDVPTGAQVVVPKFVAVYVPETCVPFLAVAAEGGRARRAT